MVLNRLYSPNAGNFVLLNHGEGFGFLLLFKLSFYTFSTARDVVEQLCKNDVNNTMDFNWISQLRYYFEQELVSVRMITTSLPYGYEYLGNTSRLVITPLTDRCYR